MGSSMPKITNLPFHSTDDFKLDRQKALGVWILRQLPEYRNSAVVRSRDPEMLAKCDIVIDVGGVYDHATLRYE